MLFSSNAYLFFTTFDEVMCKTERFQRDSNLDTFLRILFSFDMKDNLVFSNPSKRYMALKMQKQYLINGS